jgi:hypothetical protein
VIPTKPSTNEDGNCNMAKVTITFTDEGEGSVNIKWNLDPAGLDPATLTPAQSLALAAVDRIQEIAAHLKELGKPKLPEGVVWSEIDEPAKPAELLPDEPYVIIAE